VSRAGRRVTSGRPDRLTHVLDRRALSRTLAGAIAGLLLAPAGASAGELSVKGTCFAARQRVVVSGTAFTAGAPVAIAGDVAGAAQADAAGVFTTEITAPPIAELGPRLVTVTAVDRVNPANTATLQLKVVREAYGSNRPIAGRPHEITTWHFAGFAPGKPIYAHFLLGDRSRGDYRFGVAQGDCGTLTAQAPRIPGVRALVPGRWALRLDQRMTYHEATPGSEVRFRIVRRAPAA
jgi:hypothetical protein